MAIEKHYTGKEVADLLGLDYETVLAKAHTGELTSVRIGRLRRFPESAVKAFLDRQTQNVIPLRPATAQSRRRQRVDP